MPRTLHRPQGSWKYDKAWADGYWPEVERVIRANVGQIVTVSPAGEYEDRELARDYVVDRCVIACRLRRCSQRDFTVRTWRKSGVKTEIDKIREGKVRWYLYGWVDSAGLQEWMLIDLDKIMRGKRPPCPPSAYEHLVNRDGASGFVAIKPWWLRQVNALVAWSLADRWLTPPGRAA